MSDPTPPRESGTASRGGRGMKGREKPKRSQLDLRRLLALAGPELPRLSIATVALLIGTGMGLIYPQAVRFLVDGLVGGKSPFTLNQAALLLVIVFALQSTFVMLRSWLFTVSGERIVAGLRSRLFEAILRQDTAFFDERRTGELTNRLAADTTVVQNTVTVNLSMTLRHIVGAIGGVVMLVVMSPRLTGIAMAVVPLAVIAATFYGRWVRRLSTQVQDALAASTEIAEEAISGIRTVRSFAQEPWESKRYAGAVEKSFLLAARRALALGGFAGIAGFFGYGTVALVIWYGGSLVLKGEMTVGALAAFLLYTFLVAMAIGALASLWADFMRAVGASERIFELLDRQPDLERQDDPEADAEWPSARIDEVVGGVLRFEGVTFAYPSRPEVVVLSDLSLEVKPGEVVALVGPSGAGKSTVAALIPRFYDPQGGRIMLGGAELRELPPRGLRRRIAAVMQEPALFAGTIAENIRYGRRDASDEEVAAAARAANAAVFIEQFPERYETLVGERGVRLSGGQKQRVAIARAVLENPKILILDEATSALDAESEHLVKEALDRLMKGRTTVVIAHRLSTVRGADRVVVIDQGRVVESGRHAELMQTEGLYRRLVERQFRDVA